MNIIISQKSIAMEADVQTELRPTKRGYDRFDDNGKSQLPMRYVYIAVGIVVVLLALVIIAAGIAVGVIFGTRGRRRLSFTLSEPLTSYIDYNYTEEPLLADIPNNGHRLSRGPVLLYSLLL